ncbi:MAG: hypothetical protein RLY93_04890 [Sumerlaeia bacterium]
MDPFEKEEFRKSPTVKIPAPGNIRIHPEDPEYHPGSPAETPTSCCVHLRCKSMYYRADERPGLLHKEEQMGYWCDKTVDDLGPDEGLATHRGCQPGRGCYEKGPGGQRG